LCCGMRHPCLPLTPPTGHRRHTLFAHSVLTLCPHTLRHTCLTLVPLTPPTGYRGHGPRDPHQPAHLIQV
jgi:hypothetical protein